LYFGASLAPRIEQAASQIQDSMDLVFSGFEAAGMVGWTWQRACQDMICGLWRKGKVGL
jgi:hypothetical protein